MIRHRTVYFNTQWRNPFERDVYTHYWHLDEALQHKDKPNFSVDVTSTAARYLPRLNAIRQELAECPRCGPPAVKLWDHFVFLLKRTKQL